MARGLSCLLVGRLALCTFMSSSAPTLGLEPSPAESGETHAGSDEKVNIRKLRPERHLCSTVQLLKQDADANQFADKTSFLAGTTKSRQTVSDASCHINMFFSESIQSRNCKQQFEPWVYQQQASKAWKDAQTPKILHDIVHVGKNDNENETAQLRR